MKRQDLLELIVDETLARGGYEDSVFIFPSRRAVLYFKETARSSPRVSKPLLLPRAYSLTDFIFQATGLRQSGRLALLLRMYALLSGDQKEHRSFDQFHPWGGMMLNDFNDIDQNLQDISLFEKLRNWMGEGAEETPFQKRYYSSIKEMERIYRLFRNELLKRGEAYYGLALRRACEDKEQFMAPFQKTKMIFCAFNALSRGEWELFRYFKERRGSFFWDMDVYFTDDSLHEAGYFYQRGISSLYEPHSPPPPFDLLKNDRKKISVCGYPGIVQQAKALSRDLALLIQKEGPEALEKTAVILGDESMLIPLLRSLPPEVGSFNVTMGLSMKGNPSFTFIESYLRLMTGPLRREKKGYYVKDLYLFLSHPLSRLFYRTFSPEEFFKERRDQGMPFITFSEISTVLGDELFFDEPHHARSLFTALFELLKETARKLDPLALEREFLFSFLESMKSFQSLLEELAPGMGLKEMSRVLQEIASLVSVPFSGEPLGGLQVMGMLETRGLSFEHVFILGVNEKQFPTGKSEQGLIPYEFRKNAGLTTYESRDAIFAYYFYRLLMRAGTAVLYYNTEMDQMGKGERSRFIEQLLHEWAEINQKSEISETLLSLGASQELFPPRVVEKDREMTDKLGKMIFSASSLNDYLSCPLKFYLKYVEKLKEPKMLIADPDASLFGTIVHQIMENFFRPFVGRVPDRKEWDMLENGLPNIIDIVYASQMPGADLQKGKNYINRRIMLHLTKTLLEIEKKRLPFIVRGLEERRECDVFIDERTIRLGGLIDRIDECEGVLQIWDYKTGHVASLKPPRGGDPSLIRTYQGRKEMVQLLIYTLLYPAEEEVAPGLICFQSPREPYSRLDKKAFDPSLREYALRMLDVIFNELFDREQPFIQTEEAKNCEYCPYRNICGR